MKGRRESIQGGVERGAAWRCKTQNGRAGGQVEAGQPGLAQQGQNRRCACARSRLVLGRFSGRRVGAVPEELGWAGLEGSSRRIQTRPYRAVHRSPRPDRSPRPTWRWGRSPRPALGTKCRCIPVKPHAFGDKTKAGRATRDE